MKQNVLLALTDSLRFKYKAMVSDFAKFFNKQQGSFLGFKNTYEPREGMLDDPAKRGVKIVVTTVDEKLDYLIRESSEFISALFSQERTNASGNTAPLVVDGETWGEFTSLELLRLKSLLEDGDLGSIKTMLMHIPTRSDAELWDKTNADEYENRTIYESPLREGVSKTTEKREVILEDPNLASIQGAKYTPKTTIKNKVVEVGDYTSQQFSGQWTQRQRAGALKRLQTLHTAALVALKQCNEVEAKQSDLTSELILDYIFNG